MELKKTNNVTDIKDFFLEISIFISGLILIFLFFNYLYLYDKEALCSSLIEVNIRNNVCYGTINDLSIKKQNIFLGMWSYFNDRNYFLNYGLYIFLSLIPIIYAYSRITNNKFVSKVIFLSFFCFLFSLAFILRVNDWGRYINVSIILQFLVYLKLLEFNFESKKIDLRFNKYTKIFLLIVYLTSWHMPHCCNPQLGKGFKSIYDRINFRLIDNSNESTKYKDLPRVYLRKIFKID